MEAVLIREGTFPVRAGRLPTHVSIRSGGEPVAIVFATTDRDHRSWGAYCRIGLWDPHRRCPVGYLYLDQQGETIHGHLDPEADPYWHNMTWFGWLKDMAEEAGLDLDPA